MQARLQATGSLPEKTALVMNVKKIFERLPEAAPYRTWFLAHLEAMRSVANFTITEHECRALADTVEERMSRDQSTAKLDQLIVATRQLQKMLPRLPTCEGQGANPFPDIDLEASSMKLVADRLLNSDLLKECVGHKADATIKLLESCVQRAEDVTHGVHRGGEGSWKAKLTPESSLGDILNLASISLLPMDADSLESVGRSLARHQGLQHAGSCKKVM